MMVALLRVHGLLAVVLLGAITHQAIGVWLPARPGARSFVARLRSVSALSPTQRAGVVVVDPSPVMINFAYLLRSVFLR